METIYDIIHNLAKYREILGDLILEEGHQINQHIKNNITKLGVLSLEYYEYIPTIIIPIIITMLLVMLTGFIILFYKNTKTKKTTSANTNINNSNKLSSTTPNNANLKIKPLIIKKGLYVESVGELNISSKNLVKNFEKGQRYWVLVRVQMRDYINMAGTKFELHGNNIHESTSNTKEAFMTKDAYLILKFKILKDINVESLVGYQIMHFMNELNHGEYITNDFIICAIGTSPNIGPQEFYNGLKHIGYELENNLQVYKKIQGCNITINYSLLLPIHQVYDLFMDVYNNCIFESTKYSIDDKNNEYWNGKSINDLVF